MPTSSAILDGLNPIPTYSGARSVNLFSHLNASDFRPLEKMARIRKIKRSQTVYLPGDPANAVYLLKNGRIKVSRITEDGKELTLAILGPGEVFGELEVLEETPRDTLAEALDEALLFVFDRKDFDQILRESPDLLLRLTKLIGIRLKKIENRIEDLVFREVPARLVRLLIELSKEFGVPGEDGLRINYRMTHQEMSSLIGSTRETVSATLNDFRRQGLIRQHQRSITILDLRRFAALQ